MSDVLNIRFDMFHFYINFLGFSTLKVEFHDEY